MVVDVAGLRQGFAELLLERERGVAGEEGGAQGCRLLPSLPPLYIGPLGGAGPRRWDLQGGAAAKGVACPPRQVEAPPTLGFPTLGAGGRPMGGAPAH